MYMYACMITCMWGATPRAVSSQVDSDVVVPVLQSCEKPIRICLVNDLHLHLHLHCAGC